MRGLLALLLLAAASAVRLHMSAGPILVALAFGGLVWHARRKRPSLLTVKMGPIMNLRQTESPTSPPEPKPKSAAPVYFDAKAVRANFAVFADSLGLMQKISLKGALTPEQVAGLMAIGQTPDSKLEAHLDNLFRSLTQEQRAELGDILDAEQLGLLRNTGYPI